MRERVWKLYLFGGTVALVSYLAVPGLSGRVWLFDLVGFSTAVAIAVGIVLFRPASRLPWILFVVAQLALAGGDLFYYTRDLTFPSYADGLYLLYYPLQAVGLTLLVRRRAAERDAGGVLDALMGAAALSLLAWVYLIDPFKEPGTEGTLSTWFTVGYPALDLLLLFIAVRLVLGGGRRSAAFGLMVASLGCITIVDGAYAATELSGATTSIWLDAGWMISYLLWGAAALHPSMKRMARARTATAGSLTVRRTLMLAVAVLIGPAMLLVDHQRPAPGFDARLVVIASGLIFLLALARMLGLVVRLREAIERHERVELRESILRNASTALTAAPDREYVRLAALEGAVALTRDLPGAAVSVELCDGRDAPSVDPVRPPGASVQVVSLATKASPYGRLVLTSASPVPTDIADGINALGAQVALALEAMALGDDLSRQRSEALVGALVQNTSDMILVLDADLSIRYVTPSAAESLNISAEELVGRSITSLVSPSEAGLVVDYYRDLARRPGARERGEWRMRAGAGELTDVEAVSINLLHDPSVRGIVVTAHDISGHKALEAGLSEQVRKLEELDRIRSEFVATVSHELRTPLTLIVGEVEMLIDGDRGELTATQGKGVDAIGRNSERLLLLIEDLLTLSRIETSVLRLHRAPVDVGSLIGGLRTAVAPVAAAKSVGFTADWAPDVGTVEVDRDQLDRALLNLLTNAVKFTPEGGQVSLTAHRSGDDLVLTVADTGLGIPTEEQGQLFTRFFRSSVANKMAIQGTGLGLVIVKEIVEQHGGTVAVESSAGLGTTVTVRIPAADVAEPQPGAA